MDNHAQDFARQIISRLDDIKRLIHKAIPFKREEGKSAKQQDDKATDNKTQSSARADGSAAHSNPTVASCNPAEESKNKSFPRLRKYKPLIEVIGVGVLVIYTGVTIALWFSSKEANRISNSSLANASENFQKDQRPYVWLTNNIGRPEIAFAPNSTLGQVLWSFHYTDFGKTPAHNMRIFHYIKVGNGPFRASRGSRVDGDWSGPLAPTQDNLSTAISEPETSAEEFQRITARGYVGDTISVKGKFVYTDSAGKVYETGFCLKLLNQGAISFCGPNENYIQ